MAIQNHDLSPTQEDPENVILESSLKPVPVEEFASLPRTRRIRRRAKSDRGLPSDGALARLAHTYLEIQIRLWPKVAEAGLLSPASNEVVAEMVRDFKERHRSGAVDHSSLASIERAVAVVAGMYCRYSCDNSSDLSIDDQMSKILVKAQIQGHFVPWSYVFCDYSITGRDASRQGYRSYKEVLASKETKIKTTWIDDFTRASRDEIEWWRLASLTKRMRKGLIGASDGFNISDTNAEIMITVFGLVSRLFLKGLREKVKRGMRGAAGRGTSVGKLPLGFTRRIFRNKDGKGVYDADGLPTYDICIDPVTSRDRVRMHELFCIKRISPFQIARQFNAESVDGWNGWTPSGINKLLRNPSAIGVFIWNKTRRELDPETGEWNVSRNPRSEWTVKYRPELAIVPMDLWRAARRRLAEISRKSPLKGRCYSRNHISATTLFSGSLFCQYCGSELKLIRSTEKYKQMGCLNTITQGHNCKLSSSKSVKVIEDCLLSYLQDVLLTDATLEQILSKANSLIEAEAQKPEIDVAPLRAKERAVTSKISKLVRLIEDSEEEGPTSGYAKRVTELENELQSLKLVIRNATMKNMRRPRPLQMEQARKYLNELRRLLNRDTAEAAAVIRLITGPITIREEKIANYSRTRWIASFSPQWNKILNRTAENELQVGESPADLNVGKVEVQIEKIPKYVSLAEKFRILREQGASISAIASAHGMIRKQVSDILHFAETGERPKFVSGKRTGEGQQTIYIGIAPKVVEMRDRKISFKKIAEELQVGASTVRKAYDYARPDEVIAAVESASPVVRGRYSHLPAEVFELIRKRILEGAKDREIAAEVGCSASTVERVRRETTSQSAADAPGSKARRRA